ncbi:MAG: glycosyltransferase [Alphaproteobacteria bacterium]|nr:glycosyltransferase [Alphaproteobacteria bacterium]
MSRQPPARILHVICDLAGGGAERLVLDLCRSGGGAFAHHVAPLHDTGVLRRAFVDAGVPIHDLGRTRGRPGLRAALRLARLCRGFDVVHTHLWAGDTWGRLAAGLAGHPCVVTTEHNTRPEDPWRERLSVALHPVSRVVVAVSPDAAEVAVRAGVPAAKVLVIDNGVDLSRFSAVPRDRPVRRVLGIGRLTRQKGFDIAAAAVAQVDGLELGLAGAGEEAFPLRQAGADLLGWRDDVQPLLADADIAVVPSRWEGFGLVAAEALATGIPVVASDIPALRRVVGDAGLLVPPEDVDALAAALRALRDDASLRTRLATAGPPQAARFSLEACVARYEALYDGLLTVR